MKVLRGVGLSVLWVMAGIGVLSGLCWGASSLGLIKPLVVVSGSMSPGIRTGDLVVSRPEPITSVTEGDVITLTGSETHKLVTHRVLAISPNGRDSFGVVLKGDANDSPDAEVYHVAASQSVPTPMFVIPGAGRYVETISRPGVAIPLLIALAALVGLAALPSRSEDQAGDDPSPVPSPDLHNASLHKGARS